ncbi:MAG: hypothetical protein HXO75_07215 [Selenomonas artemidis]|nr:hypothetical protein [Selenomonas artemidis]
MDLQLFAIDYTKYGDKGLRSFIRHNLEQIEKHRNKIAHPEDYVTDYHLRSEQYRSGIVRHWEMEIANFRRQIANAQEEMKRRGLK